MMKIKFLAVGGTIDKVYFDSQSTYEVGPPKIEEILKEANVSIDYEIESIIKKDSLEMNEEDRQKIYDHVADSQESMLVITHGTDTMVHTARKLKGVPGKTIVLTGSMQPANFKISDAAFNVGSAVAAVQALPEGVYIAMNGRLFHPDKVRKNLDIKQFEISE